MIALALTYLLVIVATYLALKLCKVRSRLFLVGMPLTIACLPFIAAGSIYALRKPIQQGVFLSGIGPTLNFLFPPDDLYHPLATAPLREDKRTYVLPVTHKYVGKHGVSIVIPTSVPVGRGVGTDILQVSSRIYRDTTLLLETPKQKSSTQFWGRNDHGYSFNIYAVPTDIPVSEKVVVELTVEGDIKKFLDLNKGANISVRKFSDE